MTSTGDLAHLRWPVAATAALLAAGLPGGWLAAGGAGAGGFAAGVGMVAASFVVSSVVIAAVEGISRTLILPFGLAVYVAKFAVIIAVLAALDGGTWPGKAALGYGMIVAAIVWCSALVGWLVRTRYPYADYP